LYKVSAIDPNNVWAIGEIETQGYDSIWHTSTTRNNAVKWNGHDYEYYQLNVMDYGGNPSIQDLRAALTFSTTDIWFFSGAGSYVRWNGISWESAYIYEQLGSPNAAWGVSSEDFFIVGHNGSITHYDGAHFTLMESGTKRNLHDITGYIDPETGKTNVWVAGELILLHYDGTKWATVWDENNPILPDNYNHPGALYAPNPKQLVVAAWYPQTIRGYCINTKDVTNFKEIFTTSVSGIAMDGLSLNDIIIVGMFNRVAHFNGKSIKEYEEINQYGNNTSVAYIQGHVYIVGPMGAQLGLFVHGVRN